MTKKPKKIVISKQTKETVSKKKDDPAKRNRILARSPSLPTTSNIREWTRQSEILQKELKIGKKQISFPLTGGDKQSKQNVSDSIKSSEEIFDKIETNARKTSKTYKVSIEQVSPEREEDLKENDNCLIAKLKTFQMHIIPRKYHSEIIHNDNEVNEQDKILCKEKTKINKKQSNDKRQKKKFEKSRKQEVNDLQQALQLFNDNLQSRVKTQYEIEKPQKLLTEKLQEVSEQPKMYDQILHNIPCIEDRKTILSKKHHKNDKEKNKIALINLEKEKTVKSNPKKEKELLQTQNTKNVVVRNKRVKDMNSNRSERILEKNDQVMSIGEKISLHNWDDAQGFLKVKVGDIIDDRYIVKSILGKGVFANVVRAQDNKYEAREVAIKIIRHNALMFKSSLKEVIHLKSIEITNPNSINHCVKYFTHFLYKHHLCLVLEPMCMDLRTLLSKTGKHGINLKYVALYSKQLFIALNHLKQLEIIHADIKPDNILVNEQNDVVKLCDFGSAIRFEDNEPISYLVSRYYRAPEVILGLPLTCAIDTWATACTIYEITTGKILFLGSSNNKMLKCFMELKGRFPVRLIRRGKFKNEHFNWKYAFLLHKKRELGKKPRVVEIIHIKPSRELIKELKTFSKNILHENKKLQQLENLLQNMLELDPDNRLSIENCLKHSFVGG